MAHWADEIGLERRRVLIDAVPVVYRVAGSGPPVVLVHGLAGSGRWWERTVPALAARFRVHVVDLVADGPRRNRPRFVVAEAAGVLARWLDRLGLERVSLVGHSMGGRIAVDLAAECAERVERLVLVDAAIFPAPGGPLRPALGLTRELRRAPPGLLPLLVTDAFRTGPVAIWHAARELLTADVEARLPCVTVPTLVVWGERDAVVPRAAGERLARRLPRAELVVVPGAGHTPMWDRPDAFNRIVADFLSGPSGRT